MWSCPNCDRAFQRAKQPHSCNQVSVESHFRNKAKAKALFTELLDRIEETIGTCKIVSLPCCVHLYGTYDFLAVLPKKDRLEVRFALDRNLSTPRLKVSVPISLRVFKHCFDIYTKQELDSEFMGWLRESYRLKDS